ncbi:BFD-like [2Fe-2S] binding domain-containing protein [Caloramator fervidus]|uniref:BFD-like [2Fe-2S] binding domain-containing protein n=1 Tax=Caloramator fervidus TaxID=29344 RepID=A0A1H5VL39_9CLOT|nr:BFD-like [2Fe-2S] binding domain-containing protein [Caloramator fervidus]
MVYYSDKTIFTKDSIKVPVWFKKDANPKIICYCSNVTEEDIKAAVENGARTLKDVIIMTGAMKNCNCEVNNPKGKCCSNDIKRVMEKYIGI